MRATESYLHADTKEENVGRQNKFLPIPQGGNVVALKTTYGKYVVCENGGTADANRGAIGAWEKFTVYKNSKCKEGYTDCISFKNEAHGFWLIAGDVARGVYCNSREVGEKEKWYGWDISVRSKNKVFEEVMEKRLAKLESAVESA